MVNSVKYLLLRDTAIKTMQVTLKIMLVIIYILAKRLCLFCCCF